MTTDRLGVRARRAGAALGLVALIAALVVATDVSGVRESLFGSATPPPKPVAFSRIATAPPVDAQQTALRSQPWWQMVQTLRGDGPTTSPTLKIAASANQWRVKYGCRSGRLVVRASGRLDALVDTTCPGAMTGKGIFKDDKSLSVNLDVTADGPWQMVVEQQVDVPLDERPLPAMSAPGTVIAATGTVYRIDQSGMGRVTFYRLAGGRYALRLAGFYVSPNIDLELRLSPRRAPHSTHEYTSAPSTKVAPLDVTAGSLNFMVPRGVDPTRYGSLVIWCPLVTSAYAAATLKAAR